jgi:hypothetical protein
MSDRFSAYPDLKDSDKVFKALLGYGMFADKLPPCFSSESLLDINFDKWTQKNSRAAALYMATRHTNIARQIAIPHPEPYSQLCITIKNNWDDINNHIGKPNPKFNFCHVRSFSGKDYIFKMCYEGLDKWKKEEVELEYYLGCSYVVKADIATCFPSLYTHSIPWAIQDKENAKTNRNTTNKKSNSHWSNDLDRELRNCNDQQTIGVLIGPHASNIVSEVILTQVDVELQKKGFKKVIRYIDDYTYFATDEDDAKRFIKNLEITLKEYELLLNQNKTSVVSLIEYFNDRWPMKLSSFIFPNKKDIGFTTINAYLDFAISLAKKTGDFAVINYAIKVIATKDLSKRAKRLYIKKILALSLQYPYLIPILEGHIFHFANVREDLFKTLLKEYLECLFKRGVKNGLTDALSFVFYFAVKYEVKLEFEDENWQKELIILKDCISTLLAWKYIQKNSDNEDAFTERFDELKKANTRIQDKYWLFIYEFAKDSNDIPDNQEFLRHCKENEVSFIKIKDKAL